MAGKANSRLSGLEALVRQQAHEDRFWRLFELQFGTRNALLTAALGIAIPLYIVGSATALTRDWVWAVAALWVMLLGGVGLIPVYAVRKHFSEEPDQVQRFMAGWKDGRRATEFVAAVYKFMRDVPGRRSRGERRGVDVLLTLEQAYSYMLRHALWIIPLIVVLTATLVGVVQGLARR